MDILFIVFNNLQLQAVPRPLSYFKARLIDYGNGNPHLVLNSADANANNGTEATLNSVATNAENIPEANIQEPQFEPLNDQLGVDSVQNEHEEVANNAIDVEEEIEHIEDIWNVSDDESSEIAAIEEAAESDIEDCENYFENDLNIVSIS